MVASAQKHAVCASPCPLLSAQQSRQPEAPQQSSGRRPYTCLVPSRWTPLKERSSIHSCHACPACPLTAPADVEPLGRSESARCIFVIGPARSTAGGHAQPKTCCNVGPVGRVTSRCDCAARRRCVSRRLFTLRMHPATPLLLDCVVCRSMMAFSSRQHALEMNCGPHAPWSLSYWAASRRLRSARQLGLDLIHLSIPTLLHNLSVLRRATTPDWASEEFSL
jgi:hypothetical protein